MAESASRRPLPVSDDPAARRAFTMHSRNWQANRYVYPVVSRRSRGLSIGINLNPDKACNFDCIYCSVDRKVPLADWQREDVDLAVLREELGHMLELVRSGEIYAFDPFSTIPAALRRVNDIAFSGDGEPTTCPQFGQAVRMAAELAEKSEVRSEKSEGVDRIKLVVITNATMFHRPAVREMLAFLDDHNGEVWAKLDAGTADYYRIVDRTAIPFERVLENVRWCCETRPTVIQSLFMKVHGVGPSPEEIAAYAGRVKEFHAAGVTAGRGVKLVQVYTLSRGPTEAYATALSAGELEAIAGRVRDAVRGVAVEVYP